MGTGKTHTVKQLHQRGYFPLDAFVSVDPDVIRHRLPEFEKYVARNPEKAGQLTRKEAGMMSEILTKTALRRGQNVLVDGTLRDAAWYEDYLRELRSYHSDIRIAILHITAPREKIFERAMVRLWGQLELSIFNMV